MTTCKEQTQESMQSEKSFAHLVHNLQQTPKQVV